MTQAASVPRRPPAWLSVSLIVLALAGAAGIVYWFLTSWPSGSDVVVLDRGPLDGVKTVSDGRIWTVTSGNTKLQVRKMPDGQLQLNFGFLQYDFLSPAEFAVLNKARRLAKDSAISEAVGLSSEQAGQLAQQVHRGFDFELAEGDKQRISELFRAWLNAPAADKSARELPLLRALDEAGDRAAPAARKTAVDAVAQINGIVSPAQWKQFNEMAE